MTLHKMKKLLIATGIFPPDIGGPATMLSHLAQDLTARGFEIEIITYSNSSYVIPANPPAGGVIHVIRINKNNKLKYFLQMWKLARKVDLIYTTDTYSVGYFAYLIKKLIRKKYILRFTGDSAWETARAKGWTEDYILDFNNGDTGGCHPDPATAGEGSRKICNKINKLKSRRNKILFNADKIIVDCEFNKKLAVTAVYPERHRYRIGGAEGSREFQEYINKITVIPNAVDFTEEIKIEEKEIARIKKEIGEKLQIIMTSCRLTPWKGMDKILEILPELKQKIGAFKFLIMGEGSESEKLKMKSEKLNLENDVIFLGKVPHAETYNYFKSADVFILNSQYEGTSHALLDAMSAGIPILASNVGGNPELIENGVDGFLFEYNNKKEMLFNLEKVLVDTELRKRISLAGQEKVKKFSWDSVVEKTERILKYILEK
jgi:glycosyltransferase involved in cell wall biosynthesis